MFLVFYFWRITHSEGWLLCHKSRPPLLGSYLTPTHYFCNGSVKFTKEKYPWQPLDVLMHITNFYFRYFSFYFSLLQFFYLTHFLGIFLISSPDFSYAFFPITYPAAEIYQLIIYFGFISPIILTNAAGKESDSHTDLTGFSACNHEIPWNSIP